MIESPRGLAREYEKASSRIIERIESCIKDPRWEPMVIHSQTEMLRQRILQIMAGFEDADDCDRICRDGILKMCAFRSSSSAAFRHIMRLLTENPCGAGEIRTNRTATAKTKRGGYE